MKGEAGRGGEGLVVEEEGEEGAGVVEVGSAADLAMTATAAAAVLVVELGRVVVAGVVAVVVVEVFPIPVNLENVKKPPPVFDFPPMIFKR